MLDYSLVDILLFDFETLIENYAFYLESNQFALYMGLVLNAVLVFVFPKNQKFVSVIMALAWTYPGYFFYVKIFSGIYWPANYFGIFAIVMGILMVTFCMANKFTVKITPRQQIAFALATLLPTALSFLFFPRCIIGLGTSSLVAASGSLFVSLQYKTWLARVISVAALVWMLIIGLIVWTLKFAV